MMRSFELYTVDKTVVSPSVINKCVRTFAPTDFLRVDRTIEPASYFKFEKQYLKKGTFRGPKQDISYQLFEPGSDIGALLRKNSALTVHFVFRDKNTLKDLYNHIESSEIAGMGFSTAHFTFGPFDIVDYIEDAHGEDDVSLEAVSQACFSIGWDNYRGDYHSFLTRLRESTFFFDFQSRLESILGPLQFFTSH